MMHPHATLQLGHKASAVFEVGHRATATLAFKESPTGALRHLTRWRGQGDLWSLTLRTSGPVSVKTGAHGNPDIPDLRLHSSQPALGKMHWGSVVGTHGAKLITQGAQTLGYIGSQGVGLISPISHPALISLLGALGSSGSFSGGNVGMAKPLQAGAAEDDD